MDGITPRKSAIIGTILSSMMVTPHEQKRLPIGVPLLFTFVGLHLILVKLLLFQLPDGHNRMISRAVRINGLIYILKHFELRLLRVGESLAQLINATFQILCEHTLQHPI